MSEVIEDKIVSFSFDNKDFEKGVSQSLKTLAKLEKTLELTEGTEGLENVAAAAKSVDLSSLERNVESLNKKLSLSGVVAATVIQRATNGVIDIGKKLAKGTWNATFGKINQGLKQIEEGGKRRAENIANAKFQLEGLGIAWDDIKDDINYGVADTRYGLDSAAKAAAQLSASQVQVGHDMKNSLLAISGVAAMTNSEYDEIANIFTTVAGNGRMMTDQLNQLSSRGLNAAASLAEAFGKNEEMAAWFYDSYAAHAKKNDAVIQKGAEITEAAVRTLVTNGGLDYQHFADAMHDAFGEHAKDANNTYAGSIENIKAALSKVGAEFAGPFMNNAINPLNRFREILNSIRGIIQPAIDGFNEIEYVVFAKLNNILSGINEFIKGAGLDKFFEGFGAKLSGIAKAIGGEEYALLEKAKSIMKTVADQNDETFATSDAIEKANEAMRIAQKEGISLDEALKKVFADTKYATEATKQLNGELSSPVDPTQNAEEASKAADTYTQSAERMHAAIQRVWSENPGQSWEARKRIFLEEGFSEAEVEEIRAVVNEMERSGRKLSSDIPIVFAEIDGAIDKSSKQSITAAKSVAASANTLTELSKNVNVFDSSTGAYTGWITLREKIEEAGGSVEEYERYVKEAATEQGLDYDTLIKNYRDLGNLFASGALSPEIATKAMEDYTGAAKAASTEAVGSLRKISSTKALVSYSDTLAELAKNVNKFEGDTNVGWDELTAKITEAGGSVEEFEQYVKQSAAEQGYDIEGLLQSYGGLGDLFARGELSVDVATDAMNSYTAAAKEALEVTTQTSGVYTKSAEEMHSAIQRVWSENPGQSWEARKRIFLEEGFSEDEVEEIRAVVNEMQRSGRLLSSDIDTVYAEVDAGLNKTAASVEENAESIDDSTEETVEENLSTVGKLIQTFDTLRRNILYITNSIKDAFANVFMNTGAQKPIEDMTKLERVLTSVFNIIKIAGTAVWGVLKTLWGTVKGLWDQFKETQVFKDLVNAFNTFIEITNNLTWGDVKKKFEDFTKSLEQNKTVIALKEKWNSLKEFLSKLDLFGKLKTALSFFTFDNIKKRFEDFKNFLSQSGITTILADKWKALKEFFSKIDIFGSLQTAISNFNVDTIKSKIGIIPKTLQDTLKSIKENGLWNTLKSKWSNLTSFIGKFNIGDKIAGVFKDFDLTKIKDVISNIVETVKLGFQDLFGGSDVAYAAGSVEDTPVGQAVTTISETAEKTTSIVDTVKQALKSMEPVISSVTSVIRKVVDVVKPLFANADFNDFLNGGKALAVIGILKTIKKVLKGFTGIGEAATGAVTNFGTIGSSFGDSIKSVGSGISEGFKGISVAIGGLGDSLASLNKAQAREANTKALLNVALAIGILAGALVALSFVPMDRLKNAGIVLGAIAAGVVVLSLAMSKFITARASLQTAKNGRYDTTSPLSPLHDGLESIGKGIKKIGTAAVIVSIAIALLAFVAAIAIMKKVIESYASMDWETFKEGGKRAGLVFAALVAGMAIIAKSCKKASLGMLGVAPAILAVVIALVAMLGVLKLYSLMDSGTFIRGGIRAGLVLAALVASISIMGKALKETKGSTMFGAALMLVTLTAAIVVLSGAIVALSLIPTRKLIQGGIALAALLIGITAAISIMGIALKDTNAKSILAAAFMLITMSVAVLALTAALVVLSLVPTDRLIKAGIALGVVMLALGAFAKQISKGGPKTALSILAIAALVGVIAYSLTQLSKLDAGSLAGPTAAISALMAFLAIFASQASKLGGKSALGIVAIIGLLASIAGIFYLLSEYTDVSKYEPIIKAISSTLLTLSVVVGVLGRMSPAAGLIAAANVAGFLGVFTAIGALLYALDEWTGGKVSGVIEKAGDMMGKLGEVLGKFIGGIVSGALKKVNEVPEEAIDKVVDFISKIAAVQIPTQTEFKWDSEGISYVDTSLKTFAKGLKGVIEAVNTLDFTEEDVALLSSKSEYFGIIADFVKQIADITIPAQTEIKWDKEGFSYIDQSLPTFALGMEHVVTAVNDLKFSESDIGLLPAKAQYFSAIAGFTSQLAAIPILPQTVKKINLLAGYTYIDTSLEKFATGMQGVVTAVNMIKFDPVTALFIDAKLSYIQAIADFTTEVAKVKIPKQTTLEKTWGGSYSVDSSLEKFAKGLQGVVEATNAITYNPTSQLMLELKLSYMQGIADFVTEVGKLKIPKQTVIKKQWGQSTEIDTSLEKFATGLQGVVTAANMLNVGLTDIISLKAKQLQFEMVAGFVRDLAAIDIPVQSTELESKWAIFGTTSTEDSSLLSFANGMAAVSEAINKMVKPSVSEDDVKMMANCVAHMAAAAATIPAWNEGLAAWFVDNSLSGFAEEMANAAPSILTASTESAGINLTNISTMSSAVEQVAGIIDKITTNGTDYSTEMTTIDHYASLLRNIGPAFAGFDGLQNVTVEDIMRIPEIIEALKTVSGNLQGLEFDFLGNVKGGNPFEALVSNVKALGDTAVNITNITSLATALETLSSESVANFVSGFDDTSGSVSDAIDSLIQNAVTAITSASTDTQSAFQQAGAAFLGALAEGMKDTSGIDTSGMDSSGAQALVTQMANSINSEANKEIFSAAGAGFLSSLADGMSDTNAVSAPAGKIVDAITTSLMSRANDLGTTGKKLITQVATGLDKNAKTLINKAQNAISRTKNSITSYIKDFHDLGVNYAIGLRNGIKEYTQDIINAAARAVSQAVKAAKEAGEVRSPSRATYKIGMYLDLGLANGLTDYAKVSNKAAAGVAESIIDTVDSVLDINSPSKVMFKRGKQTVQGYAYGVAKNGKILVKATKKAANKALQAQLKSDKAGEAQRIANQKAALEKELKSTKKSNKKRQKQLKKQINALTKLQNDYGIVAANGTAGLTKTQRQAAEKAAQQESKRLDKIISNTSKAIEDKEREQMNSLSAAEKQAYWERTLKQMTAGSEQYTEVANKIQDLNREIENENLSNYEKKLTDEEERRTVTLAEQLKYWQALTGEFKEGSEAYENLASKIRSINNNIFKSLNDAQKTYEDNIKSTISSFTSTIEDIWKQYEDDIDSRAESLRDTSGLFDFFESGTYETSDTLLENLRSQVKGLDEFQDTMDKLRERISGAGFIDEEGFIDKLEEMGPSANANLQNLINMTDEQWQEYIELYNRRSTEAQEEAAKDINISEYNKQAEDAIKELNENLNGLAETYSETITNLGIEITAPALTVGANTVNGMIKGIQENEQNLLDAVADLAENTMAIAAETLGIHSPSRKFAFFGKQMDLGMAQGLEAYKYRVTEATSAVGEEALQSMQDAIDYASYIGNSNYEFNPVITPVWDDSQIVAGVEYMSQLLGQQRLQLIPNYQTQALLSPTNQQIQNGLISDTLNRLVALVSANGGTVQITNEFNITSNNPREIAMEVSRLLDREVQQKERTWA